LSIKKKIIFLKVLDDDLRAFQSSSWKRFA